AGEPRQTLGPLARQRAYLGGGVLFTVCGDLIGAFSLRDTCVSDGWQCRRPWLCGADAPRDLSGTCPAVGVARAARPEGACSRGAAHRAGQPDTRVPPQGGPGSVSGRRRVRWDAAATDAQ